MSNKQYFGHRNASRGIALALSVLTLSLTASYLAFAWTEPNLASPGCNPGDPGCDAPINISATTQYKLGALGIGGVFETDVDTHLAITGGNVGIGTVAPSAKLDVAGDINISGSLLKTNQVVGDANDDSVIDIRDFNYILNAAVFGVLTYPCPIEICDIVKDGSFNIVDAQRLLYLLTFPDLSNIYLTGSIFENNYSALGILQRNFFNGYGDTTGLNVRGDTGFSAEFSGGTGVKMDNLTVTDINNNLITQTEGGLYYGRVKVQENQLVLTNVGTKWAATAAPNVNWRRVAMSGDGKYQTATVFGGKIYTSYDYGASWTARESNRAWRGIAVSSDGKYQTANGGVENIYTSSDYGVNWTARESSRNWSSIAMSGDGKYQTATVLGGKIYTSSDYGVNWTERTVSNQNWWSVAMSSDGKYQTAVGENIQIYTSYNYGATWALKDSSRFWVGVAMSSDGKYQTAVASGGLGGKLYKSYDYGETWLSYGSDKLWYGVAMSSDGKYQTAITEDRLYTSENYGITWALNSLSLDYFFGIAMSSDGKYQTAAVNNAGSGLIYTSYADSYLPGGNVGIGTVNPDFKLSLDNDGGILARGSLGSGTVLPDGLAGNAELLWYPRKAAFRAGAASNPLWNDANIGEYSIGLGNNVEASGLSAVALGNNSIASGDFSVAMGLGSQALGSRTTALGVMMQVTGENSFGIGLDSATPANIINPNTMAIMGGNVGIGTVAPSARLDINGDLKLTPMATPARVCNAANTGVMYYDDSGALCVCNNAGGVYDKISGAGACN